jgi:hypothetical protein
VGFKAVIADRASATLTEEAALLDAYSLYVVHGLRHERKTGRATAAITLDVFPDEESELRDKVLKARVREVVAHALVTGGLGEPVTLGAVEPIESRSQVPLQLADLFIGAINRLHNPTRDHVQGPKDDFASYICELLGLTWDGSRLRSSGDRAMIKYL